ncbi:MAG: hypothetical protein RIT81_41100 [Deltaproteobacteria bacterium]
MAAAILALVALTAASPSSPQTARLDYEAPAAPEECPSADALQDAVSARLGYVVWRGDASRVVVVRIEARNSRFAATVRIVDAGRPAGRRELSAATCPALAASVVLAISIAIDPLSAGRPAPEPAAPPEPEPPPPPPPPPPAHPEPEPEPKGPPLQVFGAVGGHAAFFAAPKTTGGALVQVGARLGAFSAALEGRADLPASLDVGDDGRVESALLSAGLVPCWHVSAFEGCLVVAAGVLRTDAEGLVDARKGSAFHALVGARVAARWPLHPVVTLRLHADVAAVVTRVELVDPMNGEALWTTPPLVASLALMAVVDFL